MARQYHSLLIRTPDQLWSIEFGDFDKQVVRDQMDDERKADWPKGTKFKIITTGAKQSDISGAVAKLNGE